jgi:hypothetical protein
LSRVRIFLVFAALAGLATVFAACGSSDSGGSDEDPQAVLKDATFEGIESANLDVSVGIDVSGDEGGNVDVELSGPFQSKGEGQYPELDLDAKVSGSVNGSDFDKEAGLVLVPNKAYVSYEGDDYEIDPTTFSFIESAINQPGENGETPTEASSACQQAAAGLNVEDFVDNLKNEGGADVGGTETTKISGDLNVGGALDQVIKLAEDPACSSAMESAGPLPLAQLDEAKSEVEKALKAAHADVYVGDDDIVRKVTATFTIEPEGSDEKVDLEIDISFNEVNEEQEITTPSDAQPLNGLFEKLGVNPIELLEGIQSGKGFDLEGLLGEAIGGAGGKQGEIEDCASEASNGADLRECVELAKKG